MRRRFAAVSATADFLLPSSSRSSQNALDKSSGPRETLQYSTGIFFNISMETSLQATAGGIPNTKQVFLPQETLDHPFDVTLVIQNGKEFKAHRRVLSEASPFFERLLKSDMKEAIEGIIHLEMIHEGCLSDILEFIYTGRVQIPGGENCTRDLIAISDYLVLPHLKTIAEKVLVDKLNVLTLFQLIILLTVINAKTFFPSP